MKLYQLIPMIILLAFTSTGFTAEKTRAEKIKQLLEIRMTKEMIKPNKMSTVEREYCENHIKNENFQRKALGQPQNAKVDVQRITVNQGIISADSNYIAQWKFVSLGTIVDGKERPWRDEGSFMNYVNITLLDRNRKTLWTKRLEWPKGYYGGIDVGRVGNNGNILVIRPPLIDSFPEGAFSIDSTLYEVLDKKGRAVFSRTSEGGGMLGEKYSTSLSTNGRYLELSTSCYDVYPSKCLSIFIDLNTRDSVMVETTTGTDGTPELFDDGRIRIISKGFKEKWYTFPKDTMGKIRK